jgi:hypothetical protein
MARARSALQTWHLTTGAETLMMRLAPCRPGDPEPTTRRPLMRQLIRIPARWRPPSRWCWATPLPRATKAGQLPGLRSRSYWANRGSGHDQDDQTPGNSPACCRRRRASARALCPTLRRSCSPSKIRRDRFGRGETIPAGHPAARTTGRGEVVTCPSLPARRVPRHTSTVILSERRFDHHG